MSRKDAWRLSHCTTIKLGTRKPKGKKKMTFERLEKDGKVAFRDGYVILRVPSEAKCKERLIRLLEDAGGRIDDEIVLRFWRDRAKDIVSTNKMQSAWAVETFDVLEKVWDRLTTPPVTEEEQSAPPNSFATVVTEDPVIDDVFAGFGL